MFPIIHCRLYLERDELDNLQKSKIKRSYPLKFAIKLQFKPYFDSHTVFHSSEAYELVDWLAVICLVCFEDEYNIH